MERSRISMGCYKTKAMRKFQLGMSSEPVEQGDDGLVEICQPGNVVEFPLEQ